MILIKGISHTIQNNVWDTTIESVIVGKSSAKSKASPSSTSTASTTTDASFVSSAAAAKPNTDSLFLFKLSSDSELIKLVLVNSILIVIIIVNNKSFESKLYLNTWYLNTICFNLYFQ